MTRVALFNVKFSENLGDGLLASCLERELERASLGALETRSIDLAGRVSYGQGSGRRKHALTVLSLLPTSARQLFIRAILGAETEFRLRPFYRRGLAGADIVIIGGGNLLSDVDLNFPLKLNAAAKETKHAGLRMGVYGIGVTDDWSPVGARRLVGAMLAQPLISVSVRDETSRRAWDRRIAPHGAQRAAVGRDPALLTSDYFPTTTRSRGDSVGLNITAPSEVRLHSHDRGGLDRDSATWWRELLQLCRQAGLRPSLFTNGSSDDERHLQQIASASREAGASVAVVARPRTPEQLAATIASFDVIAGHRLHAHIPAYSYAIPSVGFTWDPKLRSFFESVGREHFLASQGEQAPTEVMDLIVSAHTSGLDLRRLAEVKDDVRSSISQLAAVISASLERR
jgi:polysaccharide pyruvyl transferase WcaK-like protein